VGHEDGAECKPLIDYAEPLLRFAEQHPDIPFIFHAGETLGDGTAADMNLYDAILLGTKRIGHGLGALYSIKCSLTHCIVSHWLSIPN
jgi:adenosine deaminase CECR1